MSDDYYYSGLYAEEQAEAEARLTAAQQAQPKRRPYNASGSLSEYGVSPECDAQQPADDEVVFIDGVGAGRSSVKSCRDGVQWIRVGDRVYWPLSDSDAKRLQSACCGNGSFDGHATPDQLAAENARLREALENAARSLRTISKKAGIDEFMSEMCEVRGYAESRAWCAEKDLAAFRQGGEA